MSSLRPRSLGALLLAAAISMASACSRLEPSSERTAAASTSIPDALALELPDEITGSVLRLALVRPGSWDPIAVSLADQGAVIVSDLLYDGLTETTADGRLVPALATEWTTSDDGLAWTFSLDAERTNAAAVRSSFERLRANAPASAAAGLLSSVARIDAVDDATVRFVLSSPNAGFAWVVSGLPFSIVDDGGAPTGRYRLVADDAEHALLTNGDGEDALSVAIAWVSDDATAEADAASGAVDGAVVPVDSSERAVREVGLAPSARSIVRFFVLDPASTALADLRVRQALLTAVDRSTLLDQLSSPAFALDGIVAPTVAGFQGDPCGAPCAFDPDRARALVAEVGVVPTIRVGFTTPHEAELAANIVEQLGVVGVTAEAVELATGQLATAIDGTPVDMFPYGWVAPAGSVDAIVPPLLSSTSTANPLGSISPDVDQLLATAMVTTADTERWALLAAAHQQALASAVLLPVAAAENRFVVSPAFRGVVTRADGSIEIRSLP
ncbi:MAG: ABC transporter substrate-binding protein [Acidimicrobiales bacterium]